MSNTPWAVSQWHAELTDEQIAFKSGPINQISGGQMYYFKIIDSKVPQQ